MSTAATCQDHSSDERALFSVEGSKRSSGYGVDVAGSSRADLKMASGWYTGMWQLRAKLASLVRVEWFTGE